MSSSNAFASDILSGLDNAAALNLATACLGGDRTWRGRARGVFGLINRSFTIQSEGVVKNGDLFFSEAISFDDGETERRSWRLYTDETGLCVDGEGIEQTRPAAFISRESFEIEYRISLGKWRCTYRDVFELKDTREVKNTGYVKIAGVPIMKITARSPA